MFGVSIAGILIGVGFIFVYMRKFKGSTDIPAMEFVNPNYKN